jgi:hypothetical protein
MFRVLLLTSLIAAFGLFEALVYRHGAESRPGFDERFERGHRRNL